MEDQPLPADASPATLSPGYVPDSDPEEDPEEDSEEHADYPADGGDGDDEPSDDDSDDDTDDDDEEPFEDEEDDEEEEEHPAPANSSVIPVIDLASLRRARKTVRPEPLMSASMKACIAETDVPEAEMPPQKRACLTTPAPGCEIGESSAAGAARQPGPTPEVDTWDEIVEAMMEIAPTTLEGVDQRVTELDTTVRQRTEEFQVRFEEAYDDRAYLRARVNTLFRDRPYHRHTALALDREAVYARIAWTGSEERSAAIEAHVRTLEAQVATLIAQTTSLQTQLTTSLGRIATLEARDPEPQDGPAEAGSSCVAAALAKCDASRSRDGDNSHGSGTGGRRQVPTQRECTYTDFLKCQPINFKGTEGVVKYASCTFKEVLKWWILSLSDCPKLKNGNQGNRTGNGNAVARAYVVGSAGTNPNSNVVTGTFLLNNCYASILFDTGADRSFISTAFSYLIDIILTTLDHGYDVELADGRIIWVNTLIRGCNLNFLNHPFNIDLMPVEMGSFDVIIGMDWLAKYHAVIVCDEKLVCVPFGYKILIFHGDGSNNGHESRLNIISCTKTQKYLLKGCPIFLAHVTTKKAEDKSKEKRPDDVPIVQYFLEVFPEGSAGDFHQPAKWNFKSI
ncbi:putative reverse transcriptase domain-containing protein [Tanacetum coccineum]|uniref:Reverse transcriptase domain-containing protein n=1 Tax=Tanacetum coccineum TaxID=301880 RepID=A0ABQ5H3Q2_9ASTR